LVDVLGGLIERRIERRPHSYAQEGHDQHRDGSGYDTFAAVIVAPPRVEPATTACSETAVSATVASFPFSVITCNYI
jgi:deoxyribose-phosphate aldolase